MKRVFVTRQKKMASRLMPMYVIPGSKRLFMAQFGLEGDVTHFDWAGQPVQRIDRNVILSSGMPIKAGKQIMLELDDSVMTLFASTISGSLSNEVLLQGGQFINGAETFYLNMTVKGGLTSCSYPWFE